MKPVSGKSDSPPAENKEPQSLGLQELHLREREIDLHAEIEREKIKVEIERISIEKQRTKHAISATAAALIAIATTVIGTILGTTTGAYLQGKANMSLEEKKFESALILKATQERTREDAIKELRLLVELGFLSDEHGRISNLGTSPNFQTFGPSATPLVTEDIDLETYCREKFGDDFYPVYSNPIKCRNKDGTELQVDLDDACRVQFGPKTKSAMNYSTGTVRCVVKK